MKHGTSVVTNREDREMGLFSSSTKTAAPAPAPAAPKAVANGKSHGSKHSVADVGDFVKATFAGDHFGGFGFWDAGGTKVFMFHTVAKAAGYGAQKDKIQRGDTAEIRFGRRMGEDGEFEAVEMKNLSCKAA